MLIFSLFKVERKIFPNCCFHKKIPPRTLFLCFFLFLNSFLSTTTSSFAFCSIFSARDIGCSSTGAKFFVLLKFRIRMPVFYWIWTFNAILERLWSIENLFLMFFSLKMIFKSMNQELILSYELVVSKCRKYNNVRNASRGIL